MNKINHLLAIIAFGLIAGPVLAQAWSPQRNVEIVVGSAPGGSNDKTARAIERAIVEQKLVSSSITVVNRPGGGSNIAFTYVAQRPADGHTLLVGTTAVLFNHIVGASKLSYLDFTPIASMLNDYVVFAVNAKSPIRTGKDLVERLRKDPQSVSIGFATAIGSHNHIAAGLLMKAAGGNPRDLKVVAFKGSAEAVTALMGSHLDLVTTAAGNVSAHVQSGVLRVVGVSAEKRLGSALANVPTWKDQGIHLVYGGWRSIMGVKGMSAQQVAYWEGVLKRVTETPEWKADLERNYWSDDFVTSAQFRKDLEKDYADMKAVLTDIGLAKQQ